MTRPIPPERRMAAMISGAARPLRAATAPEHSSIGPARYATICGINTPCTSVSRMSRPL